MDRYEIYFNPRVNEGRFHGAAKSRMNAYGDLEQKSGEGFLWIPDKQDCEKLEIIILKLNIFLN